MYDMMYEERDRKFMGQGSDNHGEKNSRVSVSRGLCDSAHPASKYACVGKLASRPGQRADFSSPPPGHTRFSRQSCRPPRRMSGLFGKKKPTIKDVLQAAKGGIPAASSAAEPSEVQKDLLDALQKLEQMTAEKKRLLEENDALKGKVHLLQFKVSARSASRAHAVESHVTACKPTAPAPVSHRSLRTSHAGRAAGRHGHTSKLRLRQARGRARSGD